MLENLNQCDNQVLIYEYSTCIHEMLKELDYWVKMSASNSNSVKPFITGASRPVRKTMSKNLFDFGDNSNDPQEEQIQMSLQIHHT